MLEHGSNNSLPAKYRIALALSVAVLIHTLLLSGFPAILPDSPDRHRQQLSVELVATKRQPGAPASTQTPAPANKTVIRNPPFEVSPDTPVIKEEAPGPTTPHPPEKTTADQKQKTAPVKTEAAPAPAVTRPSPPEPPARPETSAQVSDKPATEDVTNISQSPSEQDPYLIKLAMHLANKLETQRIPALKALSEASTMELELHLLGNGALTRARVVKSTGIAQIDRAAYRAALSASPYPEPPPEQGSKRRFEVKLVFSPSRL